MVQRPSRELMLPSTKEVSKENLEKVLYQRAKGSYKHSEVPSGKKRRLKGRRGGEREPEPRRKSCRKGTLEQTVLSAKRHSQSVSGENEQHTFPLFLLSDFLHVLHIGQI